MTLLNSSSYIFLRVIDNKFLSIKLYFYFKILDVSSYEILEDISEVVDFLFYCGFA